MGYSHYYDNKRAFTDEEWIEFRERVEKLLTSTDIPVGNLLSSDGGPEVFQKSKEGDK